MKKLFTLIAAILGLAMANSAAAEPIMEPEAGQDYYIMHSSGYLLTYTGTGLAIDIPGAPLSQTYQFEAVEGAEGVYGIKTPDGKYLGSDEKWNVVFFDDCTDPYAQFKIEVSHQAEWTRLRNVGRNACLGSDNNSAGGGVYTDKSGTDGKHQFNLVLKTGAAYTATLEKNIANAQALLDEAVVGTSVGNYPQEALDALQAAIATAQAAMEETDQEAVNAASDALAAAINDFKATRVVVYIDPAKKYMLKQKASGLVLAIDESPKAVVQEIGEESDNQKFTFVQVEGYTYNIQLADGESYLVTSGSWNTSVGTDPTADVAKFTFSLAELTEDGTAYYNLRGTKGLLGSDNTNNGTTVYSNKGDSDRARWELVEVVESGIEEIKGEIAPVEYYNLQGIRVNNPQNGVFIRRQGDKATKVLF